MPDKTLAFYIRLSMEDGDLKGSADKKESNSITNQRKLLMNYYESHPDLKKYQIIEFCDDGFSGTNFDRPQFTRMIEMLRNREIDTVMVKDLSRFGRDHLEVGGYLELLFPLFGTRFISVNDNFDTNDYVGTTGGLELAIRNLVNGMYSKDLSLKIRSANQARRKQGFYHSCGHAFYGYQLDPKDKRKLIVDENVREVVVKIFDLCIEGRSTKDIAQYLNDKNILSPRQYKLQNGMFYNGRVVDNESIWLASTIRKILNDGRYTGKMISKETKIDILVTPLVTIGVGTGVAALIAPALGKAAMKIGELIMLATNLQPFLMGIAVSVLVGIALTLPISSAAICAAFGLTGLAGGAAVAGCCAQMVGFAVMSFKENRWGGLVSQGIGTSMLQMGNIIKNPRIWIAPIVTSAITGPMATCLFKLQMNGTPVSSGMGTCGFVGQIGVYSGWVADIANGTKTAITGFDWAGLILISFILPAVICLLINMLLKKIGWVKDGDMKLS